MILGWYQGIPIGGRIVGKNQDGDLVVEVYPILPDGDGGEPLPLGAAA